MEQQLIDAKVKFPKYWDETSVITAFKTLDSFDLYEFFGCNNSASFTRMMKPCFPNRPDRVSYGKYVRDTLAQPIKERPKIKFGAAREESFEEEQARLNR